MRVSSSVASYLVLGGGGGQDPQMYRQKKVTYMRERAPQKHIFSGLKIHLHTYNQCSSRLLLIAWPYIKQYDYKAPTLIFFFFYQWICERAERASLEKFRISHSENCYFWYFDSETYMFSCLKLHLHTYYTINAVSFYYFWYGAMYKQHYTDNTLTSWISMYIYASERNERA